MGEDVTSQDLEDQLTLLREQLKAVMGESKELGILMAQGMTQRQATILYILIQRAPAVVSRHTLHILLYGDRSDGGPEPKIFDVQVSRIRWILRREKALTGKDVGKVETVWNAGYRASPKLVKWAERLFKAGIQEK